MFGQPYLLLDQLHLLERIASAVAQARLGRLQINSEELLPVIGAWDVATLALGVLPAIRPRVGVEDV